MPTSVARRDLVQVLGPEGLRQHRGHRLHPERGVDEQVRAAVARAQGEAEATRLLGQAQAAAVQMVGAAVTALLFAASPGHPFTPAFEGPSRARHLSGGARELVVPDAASVRRDVDTFEDLRAAVALGVGPRTRGLWGLVGGGLRPQNTP